MQNDLSEKLSKILEFSCHEAMRTGSYVVLPEHLTLAIIRHGDNYAASLMEKTGIDTQDLKRAIEEYVSSENIIPYDRMDELSFSPSITEILGQAEGFALSQGRTRTDSADLVRALCAGPYHFPVSEELRSSIISLAEGLSRREEGRRISAENYSAIISRIITNSKTIN